ncbi:hypothetical protein MACH18_12390 [Phaeobacter italicus]|uniref:hypothetical protein n=1 Tax=Phaeobacter italicus TaxID=481446 RepID=UPI00275FAC1B|nr:hypothetical protein [Phaeobacter italicus]GLO74159.1 hypothetical protein MACH18_12390 [Phaeobacter italicus]
MQDITQTARQIAGSPEDHLDEIHLFTSAWATMKAARGQGFNPARLRPQHLIDRPAPTPEPTEMVLDRIGDKVRAIMECRGLTATGKRAA